MYSDVWFIKNHAHVPPPTRQIAFIINNNYNDNNYKNLSVSKTLHHPEIIFIKFTV